MVLKKLKLESLQNRIERYVSFLFSPSISKEPQLLFNKKLCKFLQIDTTALHPREYILNRPEESIQRIRHVIELKKCFNNVIMELCWSINILIAKTF